MLAPGARRYPYGWKVSVLRTDGSSYPMNPCLTKPNRTHQDIKESNVVVVVDKDREQPVPWLFKVTDFGKSARRDANGEFPHNDGDREYSTLIPAMSLSEH